jgi:hypothetical protein
MSVLHSIHKIFKGPNYWNQTRGEYTPYRKPDSIRVTMEWNGILREVPYSSLEVSVKKKTPHKIFLYFSFDYIQDGIRHSGRWYDTEVSLNNLKEITNNTFTYVINDFKDHTISEDPVLCITRITFRPANAEWLKMLGETRPPPPVPTVLDTVYNYWDTLYDFCTKPLCSCSCRSRPYNRIR